MHSKFNDTVLGNFAKQGESLKGIDQHFKAVHHRLASIENTTSDYVSHEVRLAKQIEEYLYNKNFRSDQHAMASINRLLQDLTQSVNRNNRGSGRRLPPVSLSAVAPSEAKKKIRKCCAALCCLWFKRACCFFDGCQRPFFDVVEE